LRSFVAPSDGDRRTLGPAQMMDPRMLNQRG
jgi:hypothetical protein